jgi:polyvinyl alcohol dehydrogenase (cytochrome)
MWRTDARLLTLIALAAIVPVDRPLLAQTAATPSGEAVYQRRCAACHDQVSDRIPAKASLNQMPSARILRALDFGAMMTVAYPMSRAERQAVASYLGTNQPAINFPASAYCSSRRATVPDAPTSSWNGWSPTPGNARYQGAAAGGLSAGATRNLTLKWAFGFDGDVTAFAQPTVIDGQIFVGSAGGVIHALRADTGCLQWTYQADGPVRMSIVVAPMGRTHALLFGDQTGRFYALDAASGTLIWKKQIDAHDAARLTGSPVVHDGNVFVPVASWEETRALDSTYPCCTFRGSVVALRIRDGEQVWKAHLVGEPKPTGKTKRGTEQFGPSGVAVWAAPTLDTRRGVLYLATGDNYSSPATGLSDAVVAVDIATGKVRWSRQVTPNDAYNSSCGTDKLNCPEEDGPDYDFGASVIAAVMPGGRELLLAGQKSGMVYALDPDKDGAIVWQTRIASTVPNVGTAVGVLWGMASDAANVYASTASTVRIRPTDPKDTRRYILDPKMGGGLTALRIADGSRVWHAPPVTCRDGMPVGCSPAQSAAVTAIPGVVFSGSYDGHIRGYSAADGTVIWDFDTRREFQTVNGVTAKGGSIDGPGAVVAGGMLFVNSGYARFGGMPGNVLLAFSAN